MPERPKARYTRENKCRFCRDKVREIDYKNIQVLGKLVTAQGKIFSRKRSGNCAKCQRTAHTADKVFRPHGAQRELEPNALAAPR